MGGQSLNISKHSWLRLITATEVLQISNSPSFLFTSIATQMSRVKQQLWHPNQTVVAHVKVIISITNK